MELISPNVEIKKKEIVYESAIPKANGIIPAKIVEQPDIYTIQKFFKNCNLVGEENNASLIIFGLLKKINMLIESESGAGKSMISDIALMLLPQEMIYRLEFTSKTGLMYDQEIFNQAKIVYIPELQKAYTDMNVDILKSLTEKKNVDRKVTVMQGLNEEGNPVFGGIKKQHLIGEGKCFLSTLALENKMKKDEELNRRVLTLHTDISEEQNKNVVKAIGRTRFNKKRLRMLSDKDIEDLKYHCREVLNLPEYEYENPFSEYITSKIPSGFMIVRSYVSHYLDLIESVTKFYFKKRLIKDNKIFVNIQDCIILHNLYSSLFNQKIHHLPQLGLHIMSCFKIKNIGFKKNKNKMDSFIESDETERVYLSIMELHKLLKGKKILLKHKVLQEQCDMLVEAGFLGKEANNKNPLYYKTEEIDEFEDNFDWDEAIEHGRKLMKENFPQYYDEWDNLNELAEKDRQLWKEAKEEMDKLFKAMINIEDSPVEYDKICEYDEVLEEIKIAKCMPVDRFEIAFGKEIGKKMLERGDIYELPRGMYRTA